MEVPIPVAESQSSDRSQLVQRPDADGHSELVGVPMDVVDAGGVVVELGTGVVDAELVKKKRGRPPRAQAKSPPTKMNREEDEDVCFICFDGGSLVLCDRRGCPKAYHPSCVKRDEAFFQSKAKWNCGWHICSLCQKAAHHMCYTCTYSLCKGCIRKAEYVCVRGDKGFCTVCMRTIMLIENSGQGKDDTAQVDFDDKTSWEYLFKVYWVYLKGKLSLTLDELTQAKSPWKGANTIASVSQSTHVHHGGNDLKSITSNTTLENLEADETERRKTDEQINIVHKVSVATEKLGTNDSSSMVSSKEWATKELLDFVAHMKNGDTSVLSQFDVQALMLEYIKRNNLRDPRKKSQIICDLRLKSLFGKPRVGHFEMLKLLEFHFFTKDDSQKSTINGIAKQDDHDWNCDNMVMASKDKKRRNRKKGEERTTQNNLDEYAAIDVHNMNLVYLRRNLMENLIEDTEKFHEKVVGSIVRIRISGSDQKHDMYRLVQVVGTSKVDVPYKIGNKSAEFALEVLNLDKKETVLIDTISNQDLSEDECRRLRQSIRCGLVKRFTVGEIQEKAVALQSVRLNDWMGTEILRLNHLRDRASEKGHKKGLRECVEKLQLLKTPEERERRLREIPEVHSDPKMSPDYESDDAEEHFNKEPEEPTTRKISGLGGKFTSSPRKRAENSNDPGRRSRGKEKRRHISITTYPNLEEGSTKATKRMDMKKDNFGLSSLGTPQNEANCNGSTITNTASEKKRNILSSNDGEIDKVWHYRDPNGKVQGPFCMLQLQKWSTTGYFPADMRIWVSQEHESLLLNDVLKEQLHNNNDVRWSENTTAAGKLGLTVSTTIPSEGNNADIKHVSLVCNVADAALVDLPSPTPKKPSHEEEKVQVVDAKEQSIEPSKIIVQETGNPPSWSSASSQVVNGAQLPESADEWGGYSPTPVKREEWDTAHLAVSSLVIGDNIATPTSNIEQIIHSSSPPPSQAVYNHMPSWDGVRETIEFSTLAEESVSDLLAEVDAMESRNGLPSPTSRRNNFVEDLFNRSFEEFSPTPDQGTRSDGFSSSSDIQLPCQSEDHGVRASQGNNSTVLDLVNCSINNSMKAGTNEREDDKMTSDGVENGQYIQTEVAPPPPLPPAAALEPFDQRRVGAGRVNAHTNIGWDPHQQRYGGERYNIIGNNNNTPRERSYQIGDSGYNRGGRSSWGRQSSFGTGTAIGGGVDGGGYLRPPPKGQRVCKFYESGRCKKGASCNYLHP